MGKGNKKIRIIQGSRTVQLEQGSKKVKGMLSEPHTRD